MPSDILPSAARENVWKDAEVRARPQENPFEQLDRPGSVRINVEGAFIVDDDRGSLVSHAGSPQRTGSPDTKDIRLPHHKSEVSHMAVDIGGSLAKLVYFTRDPSGEGGKMNFKSFETENFDDLVFFMSCLVSGQRNQPHSDGAGTPDEPLYVVATGGGAYKYFDKIQEALGVEIYREDEMECLIVGLDFFVTEIPYEVFSYSEEDPMQFTEARADIYPYLLVNIGSGVSMIKVSGPQRFERIGGSSLGGGTLWGLLSLLTPAKSFDEMLGMAERGDNTNVDMLVGDIYGGGYERIGLKPSTIASSFGKVFKMQSANRAESGGTSHGLSAPGVVTGGFGGASGDVFGKQSAAHAEDEGALHNSSIPNGARGGRFAPEDISRSLLYAVSNNIGQIAYLQAQNHNLEHIYFGGSFIRVLGSIDNWYFGDHDVGNK